MISDANVRLLLAECRASSRLFRQAGTCTGCPVGGVSEALDRIAARIEELDGGTDTSTPPRPNVPWRDRRRRA